MTKCHSVPSEGRTLQCDVLTTPEGGRGWIVSHSLRHLYSEQSLVANLSSLISLHTALCSEGGGYGRKDGDEDVEDFSPGGIVVESSHSVSWFDG